jgi:hypothetical protein
VIHRVADEGTAGVRKSMWQSACRRADIAMILRHFSALAVADELPLDRARKETRIVKLQENTRLSLFR